MKNKINQILTAINLSNISGEFMLRGIITNEKLSYSDKLKALTDGYEYFAIYFPRMAREGIRIVNPHDILVKVDIQTYNSMKSSELREVIKINAGVDESIVLRAIFDEAIRSLVDEEITSILSSISNVDVRSPEGLSIREESAGKHSWELPFYVIPPTDTLSIDELSVIIKEFEVANKGIDNPDLLNLLDLTRHPTLTQDMKIVMTCVKRRDSDDGYEENHKTSFKK